MTEHFRSKPSLHTAIREIRESIDGGDSEDARAMSCLVRRTSDSIDAKFCFGIGRAFANAGLCKDAEIWLDLAEQGDTRAELLMPLAGTYASIGRLEKAAMLFTQARSLDGADPDATWGLAKVELLRSNFADASDLLRRVCRQRPDNFGAWFELGVALQQTPGATRAAADAYASALALDSTHAGAARNLALLQVKEGLFGDALDTVLRALKFSPSDITLQHLGGALSCALGHVEGASRLFSAISSVPVQHRSRLDSKKCRHGPREEVLNNSQRGDRRERVTLPSVSSSRPEKDCITACASRTSHSVCKNALNPSLETSRIQRNCRTDSWHGIVVDNFLTEDALSSLQHFLKQESIWETADSGIELISTVTTGFSDPIVLRIASEFHAKFRTLLENRLLSTIWAYKYLKNGLFHEAHADPGEVTVNLWITPDSCNLRPGGGLKIWNARMSSDYFEKTRQAQAAQVTALINNSGLAYQTIDYKCNRAVIFDSRLVHSTMPFVFSSRPQELRSNVTFLFASPE